MLALALGAASAPPAGAVTRLEGPPPWRIGGRTGFTCDTAAFPDSAGHQLEVYLRIPPATLQQLTLDEAGQALLRAVVSVKGQKMKEPLESTQDVRLSPADSTRGQGRVVLFRFPASPGPCRIQARLEDVNSKKKGLVYSSQGTPEHTEFRGDFDVPRAQAGRDLSDLEFIWPEVQGTAGLAFVRDGHVRIPNPDRLYGLYAGTMEAAFTGRAKAGDERPWRWTIRVLGPGDAVVAQHESTLVAGRFARGVVRFDLSNVPAGAYQLDVRLWQEGDGGALMRRAKFSVAWEPDTWIRNAADVADEVHFLLAAGDEEKFPTLQPGEQERMLDEFWRKRDPSPETAINEVYLTFRERVDYANRNYTRFAIERGMFSDMGRVYIRYGPPTETYHQVIPAGDATLTRALMQIVATEDRPIGGVAMKGPGGDQRPYEVWIYEGDIPVPFDSEEVTTLKRIAKRRLLFLFVDEQGLGTYTLRYSTE